MVTQAGIVDISGLDKGAVVAALYNRARPQGMGFLHYRAEPITPMEGTTDYEDWAGSFDYLRGRVMKVNVTGDSFSSWSYDRDNGEGAAQGAIDELRRSGSPFTDAIANGHRDSAVAALADARISRGVASARGKVENPIFGETREFRLTLADAPPALDMAFEQAADKLFGRG